MSDPESPKHGHYLSASKLSSLLPDLSGSAAAVEEWLSANGVTDVEREEEWVSLETTVRGAQELLGTQFARCSRVDTESVLRTTEYSIPSHLYDHVDFVYATVHFMDFSTPRQVVQ